MDYLALCQKLRQRVGASGTGPTSVASQTGEMGRLVAWVAEAWLEIQNRNPDWRFLLSQDASLVCTPGSDSVGLPADYKRQFQLRLMVDGSPQQMTYLDYTDFRLVYGGTVFGSQRPTVWTTHQNNIMFNALCDDAYPLVLDYYTKPVELVDGSDTPAIDEEFHMLIVYKAMEYYGFFENAPEVIQEGKFAFRKLLNDAHRQLLPVVEVAGPLA